MKILVILTTFVLCVTAALAQEQITFIGKLTGCLVTEQKCSLTNSTCSSQQRRVKVGTRQLGSDYKGTIEDVLPASKGLFQLGKKCLTFGGYYECEGAGWGNQFMYQCREDGSWILYGCTITKSACMFLISKCVLGRHYAKIGTVHPGVAFLVKEKDGVFTGSIFSLKKEVQCGSKVCNPGSNGSYKCSIGSVWSRV